MKRSPGYVLFVSSNTTTGGVFLAKTQRMGLHPVLLSNTPERFSFLDNHAATLAAVDEADEHAVTRYALDLAWKYPLAGVLSSSDYFQLSAAKVASVLGLRSADPVTLAVCRNKALQRSRLEECGVRQPEFHVAATVEEAVRAFTKIQGEAVVKPVVGSGSINVRLVRNTSEVASLAGRLLTITTNERGQAIDSRVLIESFVDGEEYSIEVFDSEVIGITQKLLSPAPAFVEIGHTFPADIDPELQRALCDVALKSVDALGLTTGPLHVEARVSDGKAYIVEVNPRLAGGFIPRLIELVGHDLVSRTIASATDSNPLIPETAFGAASIRFVIPRASGMIVDLIGIDRAKAMPGVSDASLYRQAGDSLRISGDFRDRIGHVITTGESAEEASMRADAALQQIGVTVDTFGEGPNV